MNEELKEKREDLASEWRATYNPSDFPGSKKWKVNQTAQKALEAFDAAHPEIKAEIEVRLAAERKEAAGKWI